jgi:hypothetical protein
VRLRDLIEGVASDTGQPKAAVDAIVRGCSRRSNEPSARARQ